MKPRLSLYLGLWYCASLCGKYGMGYTPCEAYDDWLTTALGAA